MKYPVLAVSLLVLAAAAHCGGKVEGTETSVAADAGADTPLDGPEVVDSEADVSPSCEADCDVTDAKGCDADIAHDTNNCGSCGHGCPVPPNMTALCSGGACGLGSCIAGFGDCDNDPANGCESALANDVKNCLACGHACTPLAHASAVACSAGLCTVGACDAGFGDCDKDPTNGCETDTSNDIWHCGGCLSPCLGPDPTCSAGKCSMGPCAFPFADCNGKAQDGCETEVGGNNQNCGACGVTCTAPQTCLMGSCCDKGFMNCDQVPGSDCEVNLMTDPFNCNGCFQVCLARPNAQPACSSYKCALGPCLTGFGNCNGVASDGCEATLTSDPGNCGACGIACAPGQACVGGQCQ